MSEENLTPEQTTALEKLRENVQDVLHPGHDDRFLLRWLLARKFDTNKAEDMLRKNLKWRQQNEVDTVLQDYKIPEVLQKYSTGGTCGFDKEGYPIWVDPFGHMDFKGIMRSCKKSDIIRTKIYHMESFTKLMGEQSRKLGKVIDKEVIIYDLEKFGKKHLWKPGVDLFNEMVKIAEDNYPERLQRIFVINAPKIFPIIWHMVQPFLAEKTSKKVKVYGTSNYQEKLLKYIDADQLPAAYGGTLTDQNGDPRCSAMITQGGEVPRELYGEFQSVDMDNMMVSKVEKKSTLDLTYEIKKPESALRWQFLIENKDIEFGVFKQSPDFQEVVTSHPISCQLYPEDGSVICKETGTYVVHFNNTSGSAVKVHYIIDVLEPEERPFDDSNDASPTKG